MQLVLFLRLIKKVFFGQIFQKKKDNHRYRSLARLQAVKVFIPNLDKNKTIFQKIPIGDMFCNFSKSRKILIQTHIQ